MEPTCTRNQVGGKCRVRSAQVCSASESLMDHGWVADLVKISMGRRLFTVESVVNSQYLLGSVRHGPDYRAATIIMHGTDVMFAWEMSYLGLDASIPWNQMQIRQIPGNLG